MSLSACVLTWLTKLSASGIVTHTLSMATNEKVTALYATTLYAFSRLSVSIIVCVETVDDNNLAASRIYRSADDRRWRNSQ